MEWWQVMTGLQLVLIGVSGGRFQASTVRQLAPPSSSDVILNTTELIRSHGYEGRDYKVTTGDGYILGLSRILKSPGPPVLFINGLALGPELWVLHGPNHDLPFVLADLDYDVWIGAPRGMVGSLQHVSLNIHQDEYWDFSHDESGAYDLPAMIDLILSETGHRQLFFVGVSFGGTLFMVMCSERPEYCQRHISGNVQFVPALWSPLWHQLPLASQLNGYALSFALRLMRGMGNTYVLMRPKLLTDITLSICPTLLGEYLCFIFLKLVTGFDRANMAEGWLTKTFVVSASGASLRQFEHFIQLTSQGGNRKYDWGAAQNLVKYGSPTPPEYNISRIASPTVVYYSQNDRFLPEQAIKKALSLLGNLKMARAAPDPSYGHAEFAFGKDLHKMFYSEIVDFFDSISTTLINKEEIDNKLIPDP